LGRFICHIEHWTLDGGRTSTMYVHSLTHVVASKQPFSSRSCSAFVLFSAPHAVMNIKHVSMAKLVALTSTAGSTSTFTSEVPMLFCSLISGISACSMLYLICSHWLLGHHEPCTKLRSKIFLSLSHVQQHSLTLPAWSFDFSGYEIEEEHLSSGGKSASFAEGLFKAIVFTRSTSWIKLNTTVPDTEHWREWLRQAELAANQCRTSDDIVEEVPMPRALRRHGYVTEYEFHDCGKCANYMSSMSSIRVYKILKKEFSQKGNIDPRLPCIYLTLCEQS
jgi:hypothetical protein